MSEPAARLAGLSRASLASRIYAAIREELMVGLHKPGDRFKIRELAHRFDTSDTPVREALMQLVREGALVLRAAHSFRAPEMSLARYLEIRELRILLECHAATHALERIDRATLTRLEAIQSDLLVARAAGRYPEVLRRNFAFHTTLLRVSGRETLMAMVENLWLLTGPLRACLYPEAPPFVDEPHGHVAILDCLRRGDAAGLRAAVEADLVTGGAPLVRILEAREATEREAG